LRISRSGRGRVDDGGLRQTRTIQAYGLEPREDERCEHRASSPTRSARAGARAATTQDHGRGDHSGRAQARGRRRPATYRSTTCRFRREPAARRLPCSTTTCPRTRRSTGCAGSAGRHVPRRARPVRLGVETDGGRSDSFISTAFAQVAGVHATAGRAAPLTALGIGHDDRPSPRHLLGRRRAVPRFRARRCATPRGSAAPTQLSVRAFFEEGGPASSASAAPAPTVSAQQAAAMAVA